MLDFLKVVFGICVVTIVIFFSLLIFEKFVTEEIINIKVSYTEKIVDENGEISFLVYTKDEIFENKNNYFHSKQNALNLAQLLKEGGNYRVKVVGYKFGVKLPYFVPHRNIIEIISNKSILLKQI